MYINLQILLISIVLAMLAIGLLANILFSIRLRRAQVILARGLSVVFDLLEGLDNSLRNASDESEESSDDDLK